MDEKQPIIDKLHVPPPPPTYEEAIASKYGTYDSLSHEPSAPPPSSSSTHHQFTNPSDIGSRIEQYNKAARLPVTRTIVVTQQPQPPPTVIHVVQSSHRRTDELEDQCAECCCTCMTVCCIRLTLEICLQALFRCGH